MTGDFARYRPVDGQLEFMGRRDSQIKIRGHRVEIGDVGNALLNNLYVQDVAVIVKCLSGESELAAFVGMQPTESNPVSYQQFDNGNFYNRPTLAHTTMWEDMFDQDTYRHLDKISSDALGRDFVGWTSMYDGSDIERGSIREWLDDIISTITRNTSVQNVVEIGCGTGMILFNLPSELETYIGIEPSEKAVRFLEQAASSTPKLRGKVQIVKGTAFDILNLVDRILPDTTVIINSVIQYFPSQQYLLGLIETILDSLPHVRTIFIGDVRSYALYEEFLVSKAINVLDNKAPRADIMQYAAEMADSELEFGRSWLFHFPYKQFPWQIGRAHV